MGGKTYSKDDAFCLEPVIRGFNTDKKGRIKFSMHIRMIDENGTVVEETPYFYENSFVYGNPFFGVPINYWVSLYNDGAYLHDNGIYSLEVIIIDENSKVGITISEKIEISDYQKVRTKKIQLDAKSDVLEKDKTVSHRVGGSVYDITLKDVGENSAIFNINGKNYLLNKGDEIKTSDEHYLYLNHVFHDFMENGVSAAQFYFGSDVSYIE